MATTPTCHRIVSPFLSSRWPVPMHSRIRCRLVPFDGFSPGRQVGPQGTVPPPPGAPTGQWMYFSAVVRGSAHIWRRSSLTERRGHLRRNRGRGHCAGRRWPVVRHIGRYASERDSDPRDAAGERAILSEGYALVPRLSRDHTRVLSPRPGLVAIGKGRSRRRLNYARSDPKSGKSESVLAGVSIRDYEISRDEKEVAFTTTDGNGNIPDLVGGPRTSARLPKGEIRSPSARKRPGFSLVAENNALIPFKKDGTGRSRVTAAAVTEKFGLSPTEAAIALLGRERHARLCADAPALSRREMVVCGGARGNRNTCTRFPCRLAGRCRTCLRRESTPVRQLQYQAPGTTWSLHLAGGGPVD